MKHNFYFSKEEVEKYLTYDLGSLVDAGVCPTCFNKFVGGKYFGDSSKLDFYSDEEIECKFVPNPRADGHCMIASTQHFHDMSEAPDHINEKVIRFAKQLMIIIKEVYGCERVYLCSMCDGPMNHYHVQLIPRYSHEPRGKGNFSKPRKDYVYDEEKYNLVKNKIHEYAKKNSQ